MTTEYAMASTISVQNYYASDLQSVKNQFHLSSLVLGLYQTMLLVLLCQNDSAEFLTFCTACFQNILSGQNHSIVVHYQQEFQFVEFHVHFQASNILY